MAWTEEMIEELVQLWQKGMTTNEIAKELGVSKNSIVGKVHRLNLQSRPSPIKKKEEDETSSSKRAKAQFKSNEESFFGDTSKNDALHSNTCISLNQLDTHTCRWPIGDPKDENFCFCGKKVRQGQTYCEEHAAIAYVKPNRK